MDAHTIGSADFPFAIIQDVGGGYHFGPLTNNFPPDSVPLRGIQIVRVRGLLEEFRTRGPLTHSEVVEVVLRLLRRGCDIVPWPENIPRS